MKKTMFCAMTFVIAVTMPRFALGQMISEIMYDLEGPDAGREWIEITNNTGEGIVIENLKLFENGSNHSLSVVQGEGTLAPGGFAVIADKSDTFLVDHTSYDGVLVDSAFSLNNTGEELSLVDGESQEVLDNVTYSSSVGAVGDGNTLQLYNGSWVTGTPSPGLVNDPGSGSDNGDNNNNNDGQNNSDDSEGNSSGSEDQNDGDENTQTSTTTSRDDEGSRWWKYRSVITAPREVSIHQSFDITSVIEKKMESDKRWINAKKGHIIWYMGDGTVIERAWNDVIAHSYGTPGTYHVVFEYYGSFDELMVEPTIVEEIVIQALSSSVEISDYEKGWSVSVSNSSGKEQNIGGWHLNNYTFPKHTILAAGEKREFLFENLEGYSAREKPVLLYPDRVVVESGLTSSDNQAPSLPTEVRSKDASKQLFLELQRAQALETLSERDQFNMMIWSLRVGAGLVFLIALGLLYYSRKGKRAPEDTEARYQVVEY